MGPGGHRLGGFPAGWGEWNDRYRDTARRIWRGDVGLRGDLATRLAGSADVFAARSRPPSRSLNFVTAHDGFTLADLVAYSIKHNEPVLAFGYPLSLTLPRYPDARTRLLLRRR